MDISRPEAIQAFEQISTVSPNTRIAVLTDNREKKPFLTALQLGARGYLAKDVSFEDLLTSINLIVRGEIVISPSFSKKFLITLLQSGKKPGEPNDKPALSERESEVLRLVAGGATNKEIAEELFITENTVKVHLKNILEKLQLRNRQQLAAYAVQYGLTTAVTQAR